MFRWRWPGPDGENVREFRPIARSVVMLACGGSHWIGTQMQERTRIFIDVHAARRRRLIGSRSEMVRCTEDEQQILKWITAWERQELNFLFQYRRESVARNHNGLGLMMATCLFERSLQSRTFDRLLRMKTGNYRYPLSASAAGKGPLRLRSSSGVTRLETLVVRRRLRYPRRWTSFEVVGACLESRKDHRNARWSLFV